MTIQFVSGHGRLSAGGPRAGGAEQARRLARQGLAALSCRTSPLTLAAPDASMASRAYWVPGGRGMVRFVARRRWSFTVLALVIVLAGCKSGGGSGGGGY